MMPISTKQHKNHTCQIQEDGKRSFYPGWKFPELPEIKFQQNLTINAKAFYKEIINEIKNK